MGNTINAQQIEDLKNNFLNDLRQARLDAHKKQTDIGVLDQCYVSFMEKNRKNPNLRTILKYLLSLGKTIKIVPIENI